MHQVQPFSFFDLVACYASICTSDSSDSDNKCLYSQEQQAATDPADPTPNRYYTRSRNRVLIYTNLHIKPVTVYAYMHSAAATE